LLDIEPPQQPFERSHRHVIERRLGMNSLANAPLHRQVVAAIRAGIDVRVHALARRLVQAFIDVPGDQRRDLMVLRGKFAAAMCSSDSRGHF